MATTATYEELFREWLEELIGAGGDVSKVVTLVNVYQGTDGTARHHAFRDWLQAATLGCGRCRTAFSPPVDDVEEQDDVLCIWCRKGSLGLGLEPIPGFRRTFAR